MFDCRFLRLLTDYNWTFSSLIVDINSDLAPEDEKEIQVNVVCSISNSVYSSIVFYNRFKFSSIILQDNFMESRRVYDKNPQAVNPAMFLGTAYDKASEAWTRSSPSHLVRILFEAWHLFFGIWILFYSFKFKLCKNQ